MLLNDLLGLDENESLFLAEESLQDLIDLPVTMQILEEGILADRCIEIEDLGAALHIPGEEEFWLLLTDRYSTRKILMEHAGRCGLEPAETIRVNDSDFLNALVEYYATSLADELLCESCSTVDDQHYSEERIARLVDLLRPLITCTSEDSILEICCGSGMATQALVRLGLKPIAMDSDRCDLCLALKKGLLDARSCFVLDARLLSRYFSGRPFHTVFGFMLGLIDDFNWPIWREILLEASALAQRDVIFTVYSKKEAALLAKELEMIGWKGEVIDSPDPNGIYDQWIYKGTRKE